MQESWTTLKLLAWTQEYLANKGVENSRREAEWMLCAATDLDRVGLYLNFEKPLLQQELAIYKAMVQRRAKREPLQHILGTQEFYGLEFNVSSDVLIPRHDTETLIQESLLQKPDAHSILDIGTGSGCIAITLAHLLPDARVTAIDISEAALAVAQENALRLGASIEFLYGSLFAPVTDRTFDLVVSNPPYIPTFDIEKLQPEVRDYDPQIALDGGLDGLQIYAKLIPNAFKYLNPEGWLLFEIGIGQAPPLLQLFKQIAAYGEMIEIRDGSGIVRVVGAQRL